MTTEFDDLLELSDFYILSQKFDEAMKVLKKAEKLEKKNCKLYCNMGMVYEALGQPDDARETYRVALKIDPENKFALEHLDHLIEG
jgi:Flp pilus assembly protein TadD